MTFESESAAIEARFLTNWVTGSPAVQRTPVQLETLPPARNEDDTDPWVRLFIRNGQAFQASMGDPGNNIDRYPGVIMIGIFVHLDHQLVAPPKPARRQAEELASLAANIFRSKTFSGILCRVPYIAARQTEEPWYHLTLNVPFTRDTFE